MHLPIDIFICTFFILLHIHVFIIIMSVIVMPCAPFIIQKPNCKLFWARWTSWVCLTVGVTFVFSVWIIIEHGRSGWVRLGRPAGWAAGLAADGWAADGERQSGRLVACLWGPIMSTAGRLAQVLVAAWLLGWLRGLSCCTYMRPPHTLTVTVMHQHFNNCFCNHNSQLSSHTLFDT